MKKQTLFFVTALILLGSCTQKPESMEKLIDRSMQLAIRQAKNMAAVLDGQEGRLPRSTNSQTGELVTSDSRWWCSGFYPGTLWYLYEYSGDEDLKALAERYSARVENEKHNTGTHDLGFMVYCPFGNGLRLTGNEAYPEIILTASQSLCTRYNPKIGLIRSWDSNRDKWQFPVIIDNMMNLEMLMWAYKYSGDSTFLNVATTHADNTIRHHFRPDGSCYHVVSYDTLTGLPHAKQTHQGFSDESIWSRGHAWGLYGYTMMFRETGNQEYLEQARKLADFMIGHPNMPEDKIPYWDYVAPDIPDEERDASAAAIMASALIELSGFVEEETSSGYLAVAEKQLRTLASPEYMAEPGANANFLLKHSVGSKPHNSEVDVPLTYADYYFIEALSRYRKLL